MIYNDIEEYIELKPRYYKFLKSINFSRQFSQSKSCGYNVELILSKSSYDNNNYLKIQCVNATNIKLGNIEGMLGLLVNIEDVKGNQLEGCNYLIVEEEEEAFSFYCEEFFVETFECNLNGVPKI